MRRWQHLAAGVLALCASACGRIGFQAVCADGSVSSPSCSADAAAGDANVAVDAAADASTLGPVISDPDGDGQPDLVAFYALDGCSPEDGWGAHDGAIIGTVAAEADRYATANAACRFPADAYVEVPYWPGLATPTFSVSVWTRVDWANISVFGSLYTWRGDDPVAGYNVFVRNGAAEGRWEIYFAPDPPNAMGNPWNSALFNGVKDDVWHHVVMTYDGQDAVLYLDGVEVARLTSNYNNNHVRPMRIAMGTAVNGAPAYPFAGVVDEVAIYDRALSTQEIVAIQTR